MASNFGVGFVVGATLAPTVASTFSTVSDKIKATQRVMAATQAQSKVLVTAATTQTQLAEIRAQRAHVAQRMVALRSQKAEGSFVAISELRQAVAQHKALGAELEKAQTAHNKAAAAAKKHGIAVSDYAVAYQKAGVAVEKHQARLQRLTAISAESDKRQDMRGQLAGTMATALTVAAPIKMAIDYESVMADVKKVTNFDAPGFKKFSNDMLSLSETIPMSATGLAEIAVSAGQAGIAEAELLRFTKDAAIMAVAFDITAQNAGSAMTGLRTNFKLSQDGVMSLGDSFNKLANSMDAKAGDIVNFANRVGGTASIYKITGQQVGALGATFAASKVDVESAATATNFLFARLGTADKGTKDAQKALRSIGMSGRSLAKDFQKDAQGALLQFLQRVKQSKDPMRVLNAVLGAEHAPKIAKLMNNLDLYNDALGKVAHQADYAGSMEEEYAVRSQTTANALQLAANKASRLGITLGSVVLPSIVSVLDTVTPYITAFSDFAAKNEGATTAVVGLVAGLVAIKVVSIPTLYAASLLKTAWHGAALATTFLRGRMASTTVATGMGTAANTAHAISSRAVAAGLRAQALASTVVAKGLRSMGGAWKYVLGPIGIAIGVFELLYHNVTWIKEAVDSFIETVATKFPSIGKPLKVVAGWLGIGKSDTDTAEQTVIPPTQTAHTALASQTPPAVSSAIPAARPSAAAPAVNAGGAGVNVQFNFSINGVPDADFARRVITALSDKKADVERLLSSIVNDQVRLAYGK